MKYPLEFYLRKHLFNYNNESEFIDDPYKNINLLNDLLMQLNWASLLIYSSCANTI